jgi:hypothetical protein
MEIGLPPALVRETGVDGVTATVDIADADIAHCFTEQWMTNRRST